MLLVWSIMAKFYVIGFLKNNQEWAGPANELKKLVAESEQPAWLASTTNPLLRNKAPLPGCGAVLGQGLDGQGHMGATSDKEHTNIQ